MKKKLGILCCILMAVVFAMGTTEVKAAQYTDTDKLIMAMIQQSLKAKVPGKFFVSDGLVYHVIGKNKVEVCGDTSKKVKKVVRIPEKVTYKKKKYTVTKIMDMRTCDIGGYGEYDGEELSSPLYYNRMLTDYIYLYGYSNSMPKKTTRISAKKLILPKTITYIGEGAFAGNGVLREVKFASKYKKLVIGKAAFDGCNLKFIVFPKGTTEIGDYAVDARIIKIPASVKKIGAGVVDSSTTKVSINKKNKHYKIKKNMLYTYDETKLVGVTANAKMIVEVSSKTTEIGEAAFASTRVSEVNLGGNVKVIHAKAFEKCRNLIELTGTESLEKISYGAFYGCGRLTKIENVSNIKEIETAAFWSTGSIALPISSNMNISDYAFSGQNYGECYKVTVPPNDPVYSLENGLLIKKEGDRKKVILQTEPMEKIVVPEGVTDVMVLLGENSLGIFSTCKEVILPTTLLAQKGNIYILAGTVRFLGETPPVFGGDSYREEFWIHSSNGVGTVIVPKNCKAAYRKAIDSASRTFTDSMFESNMILQEEL